MNARTHGFREAWEESFKSKKDENLVQDIAHIAKYMKYIGPPYNRDHHDWVTIRAAVLREGRRRGLDISAIAPK